MRYLSYNSIQLITFLTVVGVEKLKVKFKLNFLHYILQTKWTQECDAHAVWFFWYFRNVH